MHYIIEIVGEDVTICDTNGQSVANDPDIADCRAGGDVGPACEYVRDQIGVDFRIIARNAETGTYENRAATDAEMQAACEAIYFESDTDFSDRYTCALYLIWQAACQTESEE